MFDRNDMVRLQQRMPPHTCPEIDQAVETARTRMGRRPPRLADLEPGELCTMVDELRDIVGDLIVELDVRQRDLNGRLREAAEGALEGCEEMVVRLEEMTERIEKLQGPNSGLVQFIDTVELTGGIVEGDEGELSPAADPEWPDLASAYLQACRDIGRVPGERMPAGRHVRDDGLAEAYLGREVADAV